MRKIQTPVFALAATITCAALAAITGGCINEPLEATSFGAADEATDTADEPADEATQPECELEVDEDKDGHDTYGPGCKPIDCDDSNAEVNPSATELCDGIDNDCDGVADDGLPKVINFPDEDGDGFGDANDPGRNSCLQDGRATKPGDCNDQDADTHPDGTDENLDGLDQNCDDIHEEVVDDEADQDDDPADEDEDEQDEPTQGTPSAPAGEANARLSVSFEETFERITLSILVANEKEGLDAPWQFEVSAVNTNEIAASFHVGDDVHYVRWSVTMVRQGGDETHSCLGNVVQAFLLGTDPPHTVGLAELELADTFREVGDEQIWNDPSGHGCSRVYPIQIVE